MEEYYVMYSIVNNGNSCVWKAHNLITNEYVAIKVCEYQDDDEVTIMQRLNHPYIVKYISHFIFSDEDYHKIFIKQENFRFDEYLVIVMELCDSPISYYQFDIATINNLFRMCIDALEYLHSEGVVHTDIKLDNILYHKKSKSIKIIDFGISSTNTNYQNHIGTVEYLPPCWYDYTSFSLSTKRDIWCLGVAFYKLIVHTLTDRPIYDVSIYDWGDIHPDTLDDDKYIDAIDEKYPTPLRVPQDLCQDLEMIINKMIEIYPVNRPSATDLRDIITS